MEQVHPDREVVTSRIINAEREKVFKAWTDPQHLKEWWGPEGFTNTFHEYDLRPGGKWRFIMHGPNGVDYPNESQFKIIDAAGYLEFDHLSNPQFTVKTSFEFVNERQTQLTFRMVFDTAEACNRIKSFVSEKNEENFDRLERELQKM